MELTCVKDVVMFALFYNRDRIKFERMIRIKKIMMKTIDELVLHKYIYRKQFDYSDIIREDINEATYSIYYLGENYIKCEYEYEEDYIDWEYFIIDHRDRKAKGILNIIKKMYINIHTH
jgi:hypothetical protein